MEAHLVSGKDTNAVVDAAATAGVPAPVLTPALPRPFPSASRRVAGTRATPRVGMPPLPKPPASSMPSPAAGVTTPLAAGTPGAEASPHTGIGVLAPQGGTQATPDLVPVTPTATPAAGSQKRTPKPLTPVFHPPMRTGTSSVSSSKKATIGATARKVGLEAVKEHQRELQRELKHSIKVCLWWLLDIVLQSLAFCLLRAAA